MSGSSLVRTSSSHKNDDGGDGDGDGDHGGRRGNDNPWFSSKPVTAVVGGDDVAKPPVRSSLCAAAAAFAWPTPVVTDVAHGDRSGRGGGGRGGRGRGRGRRRGRGRGGDDAHDNVNVAATNHHHDHNNNNNSNNDNDHQHAVHEFVPLCKFFARGRCRSGNECRFRHETLSPRRVVYSSTSNNNHHHNNNTQCPVAVSPRSKRPYCPIKAAAIRKARELQDADDKKDRPYAYADSSSSSSSLFVGPFVGVDVECVASGLGHSTSERDRVPGRVALTDENGHVLVDEIVRLDDRRVVSYLTPLTGLTAETCSNEDNKTFEEIVALVRAALPDDAVLVGQSVHHDIAWLGLVEGVDFRTSVDIGVLFRQRVPARLTGLDDDAGVLVDPLPTRHRVFSLRHVCLHLLGVDVQTSHHDPVVDARYSVALFLDYRHRPVEALRAARDALHRAPPTPSFAATTPVLDGVCLSKEGYRRKRAARAVWRWWTGRRRATETANENALRGTT